MTHKLIPLVEHEANKDPTACFVSTHNRHGAAIYTTRGGHVVCLNGQAIEGYLPSLRQAKDALEEIGGTT